MLHKNNLQKSLSFVSNGLDVHDYDQANHYAKLLTTSFCGINANHDKKMYHLAKKLQTDVKKLSHSAGRIDLNVKNTKNIRFIKNLIIKFNDAE